MPRKLALVPSAKDGLRAKLDRIAASLADALLDDDVPITERIAGLKALMIYRDKGAGNEAVKSAFDGYREAIAEADDDDAA